MNTDNIITIVVAVTVFLFLMALYKLLFEKKVQAREHVEEVLSGNVAKPGGSVAGLRQPTEVVLKRRKKAKENQTFLDKLDTDLERSNLLVTANEYLMICAGVGFLSFLIIWFAFGVNPFLAFVLGVAFVFLPLVYLKLRIWMRLGRAEAQFADVLDAMINCFKTGYAFNRAIQVIADNFSDPWGTEYGKMAAEMNLGATQDVALDNLATRIPLPDVELFVTALTIQKETGGNMAELLGNLSNTIRERYKLKRKVGAISAQGKLSAAIIICVPFGLMGLIYLLLPEPVTKFVTNPVGIFVIILVMIWMLIGVGVLWKMVQIEV